jgi:hypothetical protein
VATNCTISTQTLTGTVKNQVVIGVIFNFVLKPIDIAY